jgi:group I intron endonuclease
VVGRKERKLQQLLCGAVKQNNMVGIYKITSPTNKINIGQSWNINLREQNYKRLECKGQSKLYNSLLKYGWEKHIFEIIHELPEDVTQDVLDQYEIFYWEQYKDCGFEMLNLREPGSRGKLNEESKKLISLNRNNKAIGEKLKGRKLSKETIEKIRQKALGRSKGKGISRGKGRKITWVDKIIKKKTGMKYNKQNNE